MSAQRALSQRGSKKRRRRAELVSCVRLANYRLDAVITDQESIIEQDHHHMFSAV